MSTTTNLQMTRMRATMTTAVAVQTTPAMMPASYSIDGSEDDEDEEGILENA